MRDIEQNLYEITLDQFDEMDPQHTFSKDYMKKKQRMLKTLRSGRSITPYPAARRVAASLLIAGIAVPATIYAATSIYHVNFEKNAETPERMDVVLTKEGAKSTELQEPSTEWWQRSDSTIAQDDPEPHEIRQVVSKMVQEENGERIFVPMIQTIIIQNGKETITEEPVSADDNVCYIELDNLPDDVAYSIDIGKYVSSKGSDRGISPYLVKLENRDAMEFSYEGIQDSKEMEINGHKAYILSKGTDLKYNREIGIIFEEEDLMIGMFVGRGFSEEELTQIMKGARIVRYTEGDRNYKPTGYGNWIVEQRWSEEP